MQELRKILFPFAGLYGGIIHLRNKFFDWGWLSSKSYDFPVICVGNLSVGGTGKTPMIEYLIRLLKDNYRVATLSRGYKRTFSGFHLLTGKETAEEVGDEPLQFKTKFPGISVAVDADRQNGIAELRKIEPQPEVILLDDAFQHRKVQPNFAVLLTAYGKIYSEDWILPAGNLREPKRGARRADIVIVTKCPPNLSERDREEIQKKLRLSSGQSLYFSTIDYADTVFRRCEKIPLAQFDNFCLVTGIAYPRPLVDYLRSKNKHFTHRPFPDHHHFTPADIREIQKEKKVLTTEKDFMRLKEKETIKALYYLPVKQKFLSPDSSFDREVLAVMNSVGKRGKTEE